MKDNREIVTDSFQNISTQLFTEDCNTVETIEKKTN